MTQRPRRLQVHPIVFWSSLAIIGAVLVAALAATDVVGSFFDAVQRHVVDHFGWLYIVAMTGFVVFAVYLLVSRYGRLRLGPDDARPEFSTPTWFAMLFSAGMGIGLLYFSVAEPMMHYRAPPHGDGGDVAAARDAIRLTFFHWGLHPWSVFALVGLALGYFGFRRGLPLSLRSAFYPLLGERIHGWMGNGIDTLAVVCTLFGVATSLGLGAMQVNAGLHHVAGFTESTAVQLAIIAVITLLATASVVTGLKAGIRRLSEANMSMAALLLLFLFIVGPTSFLVNAFVEGVGDYLQQLPQSSLWTASFGEAESRRWLTDWTVFYWAWWISWAPFVGMFIARISRGRTIREFIVGVLFAPTLAGFVWLTVFGGTALHEELYGGGGVGGAVEADVSTAVFVLLDRFPLSGLSSAICTLCVVLFFVTSSDSASLVIDTLASGGRVDPPVRQRVFWAVLEGAAASVLLAAGGLVALQTASIALALPFCVVIVVMCVSLMRGLRRDYAAPGAAAALPEIAAEPLAHQRQDQRAEAHTDPDQG